jgi:predicted methyltransferase
MSLKQSRRGLVQGVVALVVSATLSVAAMAAAPAPAKTTGEDLAKLKAVVNSDVRSPEDMARDKYRHPVETLSFFGIKPNMTVVELWPFGGWYTAIIAPYVKDSGQYYAAAMDPASTSKGDLQYNSELKEMLDKHPDLYSKVKWSVLAPGKYEIAPAGSADMVVTFRNVHNWVWAGDQKEVFAAAFKALKPGGVLGLEEHRNNDPKHEPKKGEAYTGEEYTIALAQSVGFKLVGRSNINSNPKDTKDYPKGVWTLPPVYAEGDKDRAKYAAIGESDRFTLKFVKP